MQHSLYKQQRYYYCTINETYSWPDFPTGGVIIGKDIIKQGYNKGRGSFKIRGEIDLEEKKGGEKH